jgi:hypothetical protein
LSFFASAPAARANNAAVMWNALPRAVASAMLSADGSAFRRCARSLLLAIGDSVRTMKRIGSVIRLAIGVKSK